MNIPMVDLKGQYLALKDEIDTALIDALSATQFILGPNVQAFDQEAADYLGASYAISCASGTDALHLALLAAGIQAGDFGSPLGGLITWQALAVKIVTCVAVSDGGLDEAPTGILVPVNIGIQVQP